MLGPTDKFHAYYNGHASWLGDPYILGQWREHASQATAVMSFYDAKVDIAEGSFVYRELRPTVAAATVYSAEQRIGLLVVQLIVQTLNHQIHYLNQPS